MDHWAQRIRAILPRFYIELPGLIAKVNGPLSSYLAADVIYLSVSPA